MTTELTPEEEAQAKRNTAMDHEHDLIKRVFQTPQGGELLETLADQYVWSKQLHSDPHVLYARIGIQDLITHFMAIAGDKYDR